MKVFASFIWLSFLVLVVQARTLLPLSNQRATGQTVPESTTVRLELPAHAKIGDVIEGRFIIKNNGREAFDVFTGGDYRGSGVPQRLKVRATDSAGNVLLDMTKGLACFGGFGGASTLEPIESGVEVDFGDVVVRFAGEKAET